MQKINVKGAAPKARAYVRVSTQKDTQKDSPENQEAQIRESALSEGIEIEHVYLDRDTATNIIEREDVQRLVQDAKRGEFNTIYFVSLSRFSRDTLDAISLKRMIVNALGIRLVSLEDFYDSAQDDNEMIFTMISSVNQKQSENTSVASKRGIRQSARKGNFTGSIAPYGYKKVTVNGRKSLEIVPEQAAIVRELFDLYLNGGMGEKALVNFLNEDKQIPSPKGGTWGLSSVQRILQNENYTGYLTFSKMESQKFYDDINDLQNRTKRLVQRERSLWEKTEFQTHEAIITPEIYQKVQDMRLIRGGGKRGGRKSFVNVFAKMVFCKECGSAMVTMSSEKKLHKSNTQKRYRYLMCSKRRRQGVKGCSNSTWVPYYDARDTIISGLIDRLNRVVNMENVGHQIVSSVGYKTRDFDKEVKRNEKIISDNRQLLFQIRKQHMLGEIPLAQYEYEREQYEAEINDSERKLAEVNKRINDRKNMDKLMQDMGQALNSLRSINDFDTQVDKTRLTLMNLIERIEINTDGEVDVYSVLGQL